jgi:Ser/Thr protein kinase RdoA (MazF antagonist)
MIEPEILCQAAGLFGTRAEDCQPIYGGHFSSTYTFSRAGRDCVLRVSPPDEEVGERELYSSLDFTDFLARGGVSVPAPLRSIHGRAIEPLQAGDSRYLVMAFEKAPGTLGEELSFEVWNAPRYTHLGRTVGRFHARSAAYRPPESVAPRPQWYEMGNCFNQSGAMGSELLERRRAEARQAVLAFPRDPGGYGVIHADLHGGNFLFDLATGRITLIDFDDCAYGWYAMDIAMSVLDFCVLTSQVDKDAYAADFLRSYLAGYQAEFPLAPVWIERLPAFLKLLETGLYALCLPFDLDSEPDAWPARFMAGRKERIAAGLPFVALDFRAIAQA